jgi:hypothetical protein
MKNVLRRLLYNKFLNKILNLNPEDISAAMSARSYGARAYHYWRTKRNMPLPGMSTLRKWAGSFCFEPGVLKPVMDHMKLKSSQLPSIEKLAVLSFDEIHISQQIDIDKKKEQVVSFFYVHIVNN